LSLRLARHTRGPQRVPNPDTAANRSGWLVKGREAAWSARPNRRRNGDVFQRPVRRSLSWRRRAPPSTVVFLLGLVSARRAARASPCNLEAVATWAWPRSRSPIAPGCVRGPGHRRSDGLAARRHPPVDRQPQAADGACHALASKVAAGGGIDRDAVKSRRDAVDRVAALAIGNGAANALPVLGAGLPSFLVPRCLLHRAPHQRPPTSKPCLPTNSTRFRS
jgi:hypothetical protein